MRNKELAMALRFLLTGQDPFVVTFFIHHLVHYIHQDAHFCKFFCYLHGDLILSNLRCVWLEILSIAMWQHFNAYQIQLHYQGDSKDTCVESKTPSYLVM